MSDVREVIEEAQAQLSSGHEAKAIEILRAAIDVTDDPDLLRQIHELAVEAHERAGGFHKLEWHKIVVESEPEVARSPGTSTAG